MGYPEGEIKEFISWSESQNKFDAITQLDFRGCYIAFRGIPFGITNENVEIEVSKDKVFVNGGQQERTYWEFSDEATEPGLAFINLEYPQSSYPHFIIYHSIQQECRSRINQILSTFRFVEE